MLRTDKTNEAVKALLMMLVGILIFLFALWIISERAKAHESWINKGGFKNRAGEWCCGENDCRSYPDPYRNITVEKNPTGWVIQHDDPAQYEFVPFDEAMPVAPPDGQLTICRRPDGTRRCVFGLKPSF